MSSNNNLRIRSLIAFFLLCFVPAFEGRAQAPLGLEGPYMHIPIRVHHAARALDVKAFIDTGCSFCVVDSTFAVDSLQVDREALRPAVLNRNVKAYRTILDSIAFCGNTYKNRHCIIIDLKKRFRQYAPHFIAGADLLRNRVWKFDILGKTIEEVEKRPKQGPTLKWKDHKDLRNAALFSINFRGRVSGKKVYFLFDTGSKYNRLPMKAGLSSTQKITKEAATVSKTLTTEECYVYEQVPLRIQGQEFLCDFLSTDEEMGYLNIDFLQGKAFILDYKARKMEIVE